MRTITIPAFGITLTLADEGGGALESELHDDPAAAGIEWCAAINGIKSLILAHACAGIDVTTPAYVEGIETAVNFATNEFD